MKERIRNFIAKINPLTGFKKLSPAWRGAILGTIVVSSLLYFIQSWFLLKDGGVIDVIEGGLQSFFVIIFVALVFTFIVHLARKLPIFFVFAGLASFVLLVTVFYSHPVVMIALPILCILSFSITGAWIYTCISERRKGHTRRFQAKRDIPLILSACFLIFVAVRLIVPGTGSLGMLEFLRHEKRIVEPLDGDDPSLPGAFHVRNLTYGAENTYREVFNQDHSLVTRSVDGTDFVDGWSNRRTRRFGFGPDELPLNGHVWFPEEDGPFPLILIVHGNHSAPEYSDQGYDYLAELLASRGYIVASVDENFLNISLYDDRIFLQPLKNDNACRGWLLLEHLSLFEEWNRTENAPLHRKIDMDNIGLIGHSRGGEAIAIAHSFNEMKSFPDNPNITFDYHFNIKALISLAGVDGQYLPGGEPIKPEDVDYLVIQGSHDMDISTFMGYNQYDRVRYTEEHDHFKASVYVYGANHGQFNSIWGRNDSLGLGSKILNEANLIPRDEQEQITKVLVSAFLDASMKNKSDYVDIFQNTQYAANWLPETIYINDYWDARTTSIIDFSEDVDPSSASLPGATITGRNLSKWKEEFVETKYGSIVQNAYKAVNLAWDAESGKNPSYSICLPDDFSTAEASQIVFSVADKKPEKFNVGDELTDFTIELEDNNAQKVTLSLNELGTLYPMLEGNFVKWPIDKMGMSREAVFQRYSIDLSKMTFKNKEFDTSNIRKISFLFDLVEAGDIYLRNVGLRYD
jgi:hypothetical protein